MAQFGDFQSFCLEHLKRLHLSKIDAGRRKTLEKLRGRDMGAGATPRYPDDKRSTEQKSWDLDALLPAALDGPIPVPAGTTPGPVCLENDDIEEFYRISRRVLRKMEDNKPDIISEYPGLDKDWEQFFDVVHPATGAIITRSAFNKFSPAPKVRDSSWNPANPARMTWAAAQAKVRSGVPWAPGDGGYLDHFANLFMISITTAAHAAANPVADFVQRIPSMGSYTKLKFLADYNAGNYSDKFIGFIEHVNREVMNQYYTNPARFMTGGGAIDQNATIFTGRGGAIDRITNGLNPDLEDVDWTAGGRIDMFKAPPAPPAADRSYKKLLDLIYSSEKFRTVFEANGGNQITTMLARAKANADYGQLKPALTDKKGILEAAAGKLGEIGDEHLSKLFGSRHEAHKYTKLEAKAFIEAIRKLEITPQQGLAGIMALESVYHNHGRGPSRHEVRVRRRAERRAQDARGRAAGRRARRPYGQERGRQSRP